ncbi:hypothetical protein [Streptococcus suis]|uniref:Parvulin-like peptidyl-prolyl isomerase n=1 Tax=Streptococcus suis TaxID=1307 RepID=A0A426GB36_STRSU|nr:hypothetical protein [Streptococcus suis]MBY4965169.1 hypothetical protein [Streptococcus suis]MDW8777731.1 hypothetical protein [Streptococcus suis]RRN52497.1 hypothetical protein EI220_01335 [Streptococcus suis]TII04180.1 hypothetical protein FAJ35_00015 [Streptococcus suis]HEL1582370.1 hypothetical protein [Streptococcus suis]
MINEEKVNQLKMVGTIAAVVLLVIIGISIGFALKPTTETTTEPTEKVISDASDDLTRELVEDFLISYFTKKDLEENRNRYKEFMTEGMYNQEVSKEDEAVNQTYKGFVVDYVYKDADIYIDTERNVVIAKVRYTNTLLAEKNNYDKAQKDVMNETTIQLSYLKEGNSFKVNTKEEVVLVSSSQTSSYPAYGTVSTSIGD